MSQINDCQLAALVLGGYGDQWNDGMLAWAKANGGTSNDLDDCIYEMLLAQGATRGQVNDMWYEALVNLGVTPGALSDMLFEFWCTLGGAFNFMFSSGWMGLEDCGGLSTYKLNVEIDNTLYGYRDPSDAGGGFGAVLPVQLPAGNFIYALYGDTSGGADLSVLQVGPLGDEQSSVDTILALDLQGYPASPVDFTWSVGNSRYEVTGNTALVAYFKTLDLQRTSFEVSGNVSGLVTHNAIQVTYLGQDVSNG